MRPLSTDERRTLAAATWLPVLGPYGALTERWTVHLDDPELHALISASFIDLLVDEAPPAAPGHGGACTQLRLTMSRTGTPVLARDDHRIGNPRDQVGAFALLVWAINRLVLEDSSRQVHLLHAGGAVRSDGTAVLLPAPSGSGKSTLTLALLERGLDYLSDEAVALDDDGRLHGYPKPVSIDDGAFPLFARWRPPRAAARILGAQWQVPASSVTGVAAEGQLRLVIFPCFQPGTRTHLELLSPGAATIEAAACSFADPSRGHVTAEQVRRLAATVGRTPTYRLVMSEPEAACELVLRQLDRIPYEG